MSARPDRPAEPSPPLDPARIASLQELAAVAGPGLLVSLTTTFVDRSGVLVTELQKSVTASDLGSGHAAAHELKGSAATMGAVRVARLAAELEVVLQAGQPPRPGLLDELGVELDRATSALATLLTPPPH